MLKKCIYQAGLYFLDVRSEASARLFAESVDNTFTKVYARCRAVRKRRLICSLSISITVKIAGGGEANYFCASAPDKSGMGSVAG